MLTDGGAHALGTRIRKNVRTLTAHHRHHRALRPILKNLYICTVGVWALSVVRVHIRSFWFRGGDTAQISSPPVVTDPRLFHSSLCGPSLPFHFPLVLLFNVGPPLAPVPSPWIITVVFVRWRQQWQLSTSTLTAVRHSPDPSEFRWLTTV